MEPMHVVGVIAVCGLLIAAAGVWAIFLEKRELERRARLTHSQPNQAGH